MAYTLIETVELAGSQSTITFSSIPQTYKHLELVVSARSDRTGGFADGIYLNLNGSTTDGNRTQLYGVGGGFGTGNDARIRAGSAAAVDAPANTFNSSRCLIADYTASKTKAVKNESVILTSGADHLTEINAMFWNDTSAVTSIELALVTGGTNFIANTVISLYGIS